MPANSTRPAGLQQISEHIRDWRTTDVVVDHANRLVRNIALTAIESANGYRYSEQALNDAVPLYVNKPVFLDHARNLSRPFDRSTRDLVGSVVNPRFEGGRIRGDIQALDTEAGRTFIALAESKSPAVGMSHIVLARRNANNTIVEKIEQVVSVDAVAFPATASTFGEQRRTSDRTAPDGSLESILERVDAALSKQVEQIGGEEIREVRRVGVFPDHVRFELNHGDIDPSLRGMKWSLIDGEVILGDAIDPIDEHSPMTPWTFERDSQREQELQSLTAERDRLATELEQQQTLEQQADRMRRTERLLAESRLPAFAVTDQWRDQLLSAPDDERRRELIAERQTLLRQLRVLSPGSVERLDATSERFDDELIVAAIRGRRTDNALSAIGTSTS